MKMKQKKELLVTVAQNGLGRGWTFSRRDDENSNRYEET